MTATVWDEQKDPNGWWASEKYDGIRLLWDGNKFYSRQGNRIYAPKHITESLPNNVSLDGELW